MNVSMKIGYLLPLVAGIAFAGDAHGGCLETKTTSGVVYSKVRGFIVGSVAFGSAHYVIVDKATCQADASGDVTLGQNTKDHHYLRLRDADKPLFSALLAAQAQGINVAFRLAPGAPNSDGYNEIAYIYTPSNAPAQ